jgi:pimeloyl-ACP methyl ester carboxylesterase
VARLSRYIAALERVRAAVLPARDPAPHVFAHSIRSVVALLAASRHPGHWRIIVVQGFSALPGRNIPTPLEIPVRVARRFLGTCASRPGWMPALGRATRRLRRLTAAIRPARPLVDTRMPVSDTFAAPI